ncbi:MAG: cytidylyltransferase domain-containing protein [Candidatus Scalinduaceae bacterium]
MKNSQKGNRKTIAIIPARGGSKDIPHKNVKLLVGKPLIHYVIETCLQTPEVNTVVVSTDSSEIKEAVSKFKEVKIIDRPAALAADDTTSEEVLLHAIEQLEKESIHFDIVLFAQATSPLSEPSDFSGLLEKIKDGCDSAAFYVEDFGFFFGESDILSARRPRQDRKPRKREAGNAWAFSKQEFIKHKSRTFGQIGLCKIEYPKNLEVDSEDDLYVIERLLQLRERKKRHMYYQIRNNKSNETESKFESNYWSVIVDPDGKKRDRNQEREQRIEDVKEEFSYINQLPPGRILDIGCGMGDLLSGVNNDWEKYGVEVSELAAQEAAKYGNIFVGCLKDAPYKDEFFDLIVMHHAIEHFSNVEDEMVVVRDLLKHNGKLIVGTPDFDGAMARRYGEKYRLLHDKTHISLFSRISLRHFLEDFGFEIEKEVFPFFETRHFTKENLLRLLNGDQVSPPFWGSFMTFYCVKK